MHFCSAYIALGGDIGNVVFRGPDNPLSWPEIGLLQFIHGEENVYNCEVLREVIVRPAEEKQRLLEIYGEVVEKVYPGRAPMLEMEMPGGSAPSAGAPPPQKQPEKIIAGREKREAAASV